MPIHEIDPWRAQYFAGIDCPADVHIPTEDSDAWEWNPQHAWVYDKLAVAQSQGLQAGPHGTRIPFFPVFSKPVCNLRGMGAGSRVISSAEDYERHFTPGHFWMTMLEGPHVSSDAAIVSGVPRWWRHASGKPAGEGTFDSWTIHAAGNPAIESGCSAWIAKHLAGYTGMINIETIGGTIIEAHLRFTDQWPDLYGPGWVEAVVGLYARGTWQFADRDRREGYSVVLFGPHGLNYGHPPAGLVAELRAMPGVSSVQITFHEDRPPEYHSMPPGGFRLAIVNALDLAAGLQAREKLRHYFFPA
ncbi:MAG TPA: hypothetical protein VHA55_04360 [Pseudorhodoplanes sp.]|jgi:hypothetical protein|nr:hypothetical protein [Pseudorhodoplanes sp.]